MKKTALIIASLVVVGLLLGTGPVFAGEYDGLWASPAMPGQFFMIRDNGGYVLGVAFDLEGSSEIFIGTMEENVGTATDLQAHYDATLVFTFTSSTTCTVTLTSCTGDCSEAPPANVPIPMQKIF